MKGLPRFADSAKLRCQKSRKLRWRDGARPFSCSLSQPIAPASSAYARAALALSFETPKLAITAHLSKDDFAGRLDQAIARK